MPSVIAAYQIRSDIYFSNVFFLVNEVYFLFNYDMKNQYRKLE